MDNVKGSATAFCTFSPYKSRVHGLLSSLTLRLGFGATDGARERRFLHTAHFSPVTARMLRRAGISSKGLENGALLFISCFNGDAEKYFRGFSEQLATIMNNVWSYCVDWQDAGKFENLDAFITFYRRRSASFFNAYPDDCSRVRASVRLQRQLDRLRALALSTEVSDAEFATAFQRVAQIQWGNVVPAEQDL